MSIEKGEHTTPETILDQETELMRSLESMFQPGTERKGLALVRELCQSCWNEGRAHERLINEGRIKPDE